MIAVIRTPVTTNNVHGPSAKRILATQESAFLTKPAI
jgi:hypothetical protein